ncbi:Aste57867_13685 [Aphanomyces stellatus]|uniref:Aste57867_13685 protein n=1 Tax=Aphanomyces stellatus TaxID=120398 RepID=A0A485KZH2_9STRA|nr:hypothetical protein As57867_013635 [Aphanomyces stellatus]VFT90518.1 Aste57867_13685 [Aphanomyces stellatus]
MAAENAPAPVSYGSMSTSSVVAPTSIPTSQRKSSLRKGMSSRVLSLRNMHIGRSESKKGFNPFVYQTPTMTPYELVKTVLMCVLLIPLIRLLLVLVLIIPVVLLAFLGTLGHKHQDADGHLVPMATWRRVVVHPIRWFLRLILFVFGFYYIKTTYPKKKSHHKTQLIIANHIGFIDGLFFGAQCFPSVAVRGDMGDAPIIGPVLRAMDPVLIDRKSAQGRKRAFDDIRDHMVNDKFPPLLIFPEGTTSNQDYLTKFKKGAFAAGLPVQPVILKYPFRHFDISWPPAVSASYLLFRMLCQVYMPMEVTYMDPYVPNAAEQTNADLYAENVRQYMARAMNAKCTNHTFEDVRLLCQVGQYAIDNVVHLTDVGEIFKLTQMPDDEIQALVQHFASTDKDHDGKISLEELQAQFDEDPAFVARLFHILDQDEDGRVDFRELCIGLSTLNQASSAVNPTDLYRLAFKLYDADGDMKLSPDEIAHMLKMTRSMTGITDDKSVDELVESFDTDGDGHISFDEFERMASANPHVLAEVVDRLKVLRTLDVLQEEP